MTLPRGYDPDAVQCSYDYNLGASAPEQAIAKLRFTYAEVPVGSIWLLDTRESALELDTFRESGQEAKEARTIPVKLVLTVLGAAVTVFLGVLIALLRHAKVQEEREREERFKERRRRRLEEMHLSEDEFRAMVANRYGGGERTDLTAEEVPDNAEDPADQNTEDLPEEAQAAAEEAGGDPDTDHEE